MRYEVPQFIDVKEKIIGPLTGPQLLFLGGGGGGAYIAIRTLPGIFGYMVALIAIGLSIALAFGQYNGRPFPVMLYAIISHYLRPRRYLWQYTNTTRNRDNTKNKQTRIAQTGSSKKISDQKIRDISWTLDILDR